MNPLFLYESMGALSAQMAEAAHACDWDRLVALERDCAGLARRLEAEGEAAPLTENEREQKIALIRRIFADDAEVRRHTESWMEQVKPFLGAGTRGRDLRRAYGLNAGQ